VYRDALGRGDCNTCPMAFCAHPAVVPPLESGRDRAPPPEAPTPSRTPVASATRRLREVTRVASRIAGNERSSLPLGQRVASSRTEYFHVIRKLDRPEADPSVAVRGPFDERAYSQQESRLALPAFTHVMARSVVR
jgi:hypothetical protein